MVRRADELWSDPAVVVIDEPARSVDEWLESLRWEEPLALNVTGAELVAEARADEE